MLGKLTSLFTTAKPIGVAIRDITMMVGAVLAVLGALGVLTPQQVLDLTRLVEEISGQVPALLAGAGVLIAGGVSFYRIVTKSSSDKAQEMAKTIDQLVPAGAPILVKTPPGLDDVQITADGKGTRIPERADFAGR